MVYGYENLSLPWHNDRNFADEIFKYIFVNEKFRILSRISLKFVPKGPINNKSALVQVMAWHQAITETNADQLHWRIYTAEGDEFSNIGILLSFYIT